MPRKISSGKVGRSVLGDIFAQDNSIRSVETNANIALSPDGTGIVESDSDIQLNATNGVRFADSDSSNYVLIKAPGTVASNVTLTLPANDGDASQVLSTDGNGVLSWVAAGLTIANRTAADSNNYYIAMSDQTTGTEDTLSVADGSRFFYTPNADTGTGRLTVGNASLTASTASSSTTTGALVVTGGVGIGGSLYAGNTVRFTNNTASSSTSTGALVVTGGVGIGGQMTAVSIVETSSIALKENIKPIQNGLDSILKLKGVTYDRKDNGEHESGLIAEWVEEMLPELVTRDADGAVVGIKYTKLTAYLIEAIKSLNTKIDELKGK